MLRRLPLLLVVGLVASLVLVGCSGTVSGTIVASGSTALQPLVQQAADKFMAKNPKARITVNGGGSGTGLSQVAQGQVNIGMSDIFAEEKEGIDASQLKDYKVAVVGFAIVVNPDVKVDNLTQEQVVGIFTGKIKNWSEVGGQDLPIVVINRPKSSGTRATFKKYALGGVEEAETAMTEDSSGQVKKIVSETPGAISYLALSYVDNSVKALKFDGNAPTVENITTGKYPIWSYEHLYTKGEPTGLTKAFIQYMLSQEVQNDLVTKLGYIPITSMKVTRNP
ncbi:MAG TPA: phosphate ABC transporter substrate-binding protein [Firmicutes bacterium]|uniref:Phosphate-binding protein n=1 Tax=Candidatus Fermentithermobacillus carboniphilus TaxID=3085328 RepID=A0AAT9LDI7_9FIRM|nr:MAG: phosphate ABC transporter substrate-binding protein [Candidatus Fermentithermobacillus carboniphilus]HHW18206.1 phosphate ABC transporter substrate-binding protein [Candidatus Fermentithermobacillaceae bacterium]